MHPLHNLFEKITLGAAGLLAGALVFLGEPTVHHAGRVISVLLLFAAILIAGTGWLLTGLHAAHPPGTRAATVALMLIVGAFAAAVIGYGVNTLEVRAKLSRTNYSELDLSAGATATAERRVRSIGIWLAGAVLLGIASLAAFVFKRPVVGSALAIASLGLTGWKVAEFENLIKELKVAPRLSWNRTVETAPPPPPAKLELLMSARIGPFVSGRATLNENLKSQVRNARDAASNVGEISHVVLVGHVDRRSLVRDTAKEYASNQGLAIQRASAVERELGLTAVASTGGPAHTRTSATEGEMADDRRVDAFFFGFRSR